MVWQDRLSLAGQIHRGPPKLRFIVSHKCVFHLGFSLAPLTSPPSEKPPTPRTSRQRPARRRPRIHRHRPCRPPPDPDHAATRTTARSSRHNRIHLGNSPLRPCPAGPHDQPQEITPQPADPPLRRPHAGRPHPDTAPRPRPDPRSAPRANRCRGSGDGPHVPHPGRLTSSSTTTTKRTARGTGPGAHRNPPRPRRPQAPQRRPRPSRPPPHCSGAGKTPATGPSGPAQARPAKVRTPKTGQSPPIPAKRPQRRPRPSRPPPHCSGAGKTPATGPNGPAQARPATLRPRLRHPPPQPPFNPGHQPPLPAGGTMPAVSSPDTRSRRLRPSNPLCCTTPERVQRRKSTPAGPESRISAPPTPAIAPG